MKNLLDFIHRGRQAQKAVDDIILIQRIRTCLNRWAARYAASPHAKRHLAETNLLISEIDGWLKKLDGQSITTETLATMIRKRLRILALDAPAEWRAVMEAEADALADIIREFR